MRHAVFRRRGGRVRSAAQRTERTTLLAHVRCAACVNALWFCGKQLNTEGRERRCWWARCVKDVLALLPGLGAGFPGVALAARASPLATGCDPCRDQTPVAAQLGYFTCASRRTTDAVCRDELRGCVLDLRGFDSRWHKGSVSSVLSDGQTERAGMLADLWRSNPGFARFLGRTHRPTDLYAHHTTRKPDRPPAERPCDTKDSRLTPG